MSEQAITILHVEDDQVDKMVIERVIKKLKLTNTLLHASNGEEALDVLRGTNGKEKLESLPQVVLLDINMPKMNGLEFLKELRNDPEFKSISVFVMTTSNDDNDKIEAYKMNVAGYILKPLSFEKFVNSITILNSYWKLCEQPEISMM